VPGSCMLKGRRQHLQFAFAFEQFHGRRCSSFRERAQLHKMC
jgi:hypothetical protein